ncbi:MAG: phosphate acyltransferase PlsX [Solirubrobacterales bacterium]
MTTVALDAMGADRGVKVTTEGARIAAADGIEVLLVGSPELAETAEDIDGVRHILASQTVGNTSDPVRAVRSAPDASIVRACAEVAEGRAHAVVSASSTGATLAASTFALRRLPGVQRPALAVQLPVPGHPVLFLDAGANAEARPGHLVQFASMGTAFAQAVLDVENPRVGLLSVGEEAGKGTPTVIEAHRVLSDAPGIDFHGNVEGTDLTTGTVDVIVTDGFTGNVTLKTMEGTARVVGQAVRDAARANPLSAAGGLLMRPALGSLRRDLDPDTTGGALLLGLRAPAVVCHGSAGPEGIANAIRLAERTVASGAVERTAELLARSGSTRAALRDRQEVR